MGCSIVNGNTGWAGWDFCFLGIEIPILTWGSEKRGGIDLGHVENNAQVYPPG